MNDIKENFERLFRGGTIRTRIDERVDYSQSKCGEEAVWSLLLASGYLKVLAVEQTDVAVSAHKPVYELTLTNYETHEMFIGMVQNWFAGARSDYNDFIKALLQDDIDAMNDNGRTPGTGSWR